MQAVPRTRDDGYCRESPPKNDKGARQGAPRSNFLKLRGREHSRTGLREVRAPS